MKLFKGKKKWLLFIFVLILAGAGYYFFKPKSDKLSYDTYQASKGKLEQTVSASGTIKSSKDIKLGFKIMGEVSEISVKQNDEVLEGQILARLESSDLAARIRQQEASVLQQQSALEKLLDGAIPEDIAITQASVDNARIVHENSLKELDNTIRLSEENEKIYREAIKTAKNSLEEAVISLANTKNTYQLAINSSIQILATAMNNNLSTLSNSLKTADDAFNYDNASETLGVKDANSVHIYQNNYNLALSQKNGVETLVKQALTNPTVANVNQAYNSFSPHLLQIKTVLNNLNTVLLNTIVTFKFSQAELNTLEAGVVAEQSAINSVISSVESAKQNLDSARLSYNTYVDSAAAKVVSSQDSSNSSQLNLSQLEITNQKNKQTMENAVSLAKSQWEIAQKQLELKKAPPRQSDIAVYRAQVFQAQAMLESVKSQYEDTVLRAPIDGKITKINYEKGEQFASAKSMIEMVGDAQYIIETLVSEIDIAKIKIGNKTDTTLDAYSSEKIFKGNVINIEPAETLIQDVVYYKVQISIDDDDFQAKPGMSTDTTIHTAELPDVIYIPQRAIYQSNSEKYVRIFYDQNNVEEREITTGLLGDNGYIQILSGIDEGEMVVTYIRNNAKK